MTIYARIAALCLLPAFISTVAGATDATPEGEWLVKDKTAHIRVVSCAGKMWGFISWTKEPGVDSNNPDPAKRSRPVLGLPILRHMQAEEEGWDGDIYNADNGKIYNGNITLSTPDMLHVKGCLIGHVLCGGENWTRLPAQYKEESTEALCDGAKD